MNTNGCALKGEKGAIMEHHIAIAIDNVCAWPNLTKMPDGAIIATIFNQPCHGLWEGDVECWASEDGDRLSINFSTSGDGRLVTAWYSSAAPGVHERYHMGAAVWSLPESLS